MKKPKPNFTKTALPLLLLITVLLFGALQSCVDHQDCDRDNPEVEVDSLEDRYNGRFPYKPTWTELEFIYEDDSTEAEVLTFQLYQRDTLDHDYNGWDGGGIDCTTYKDEVNRYYYKASDSYGRKHHFIIERRTDGIVLRSFHIVKVDHFGANFRGIGWIQEFGPFGIAEIDSVIAINGQDYFNVFSNINMHIVEEDTIYHKTCFYNIEYGLLKDIDHVKNRVYTLKTRP